MNNSIPAVERTMALLELLAESPDGLSQAELRRKLGLSMSSTYRILQTLLVRDWVKKSSSGRYTPGNGQLLLWAGSTRPLPAPDALQEVLDHVAKGSGIAAKLSIRSGMDQVTILRAEPDAPVQLTGRKFSRFPLAEGSVGAALLADEPQDSIRRIAAAGPEDLAERRDPEMILRKIAGIRKNGCAWSESARWHIRAVSAPVRDREGAVRAALTFIFPAEPLSGTERNRLGRLLNQTIQSCEERIAK